MDFSSLCDRINNIVQDRLFQSDFDKYLGEASPFAWEASPSGWEASPSGWEASPSGWEGLPSE